MTTEQKLREALADVVAQACGEPKSCGHEFYCICPGDAARAALALPPSETREEWRVRYSMGGPQVMAACDLADAQNLAECLDGKVTIESRTVALSPWSEVPAGIPPSPQAECADLIRQVFDKMIDGAAK